ncbi:MAG: hypothetical protein Q9226_000436 [Calogaya cf. arnoldii]
MVDDNTPQRGRATSQDIDPDSPSGTMSSTVILKSRLEPDNITETGLSALVAVGAMASQIAEEKATRNEQDVVHTAREQLDTMSGDVASPTPSLSPATGERPQDSCQGQGHLLHVSKLTDDSTGTSQGRPEAYAMAMASPMFRTESYNRGDSPDRSASQQGQSTSRQSRSSSIQAIEHNDYSSEGEMKQEPGNDSGRMIVSEDVRASRSLTLERAGLDPQARLHVGESETPDLENEQSALEIAEFQACLASDTNSDAQGNLSMRYWSLPLIAWCLSAFATLGVREAPLAAGKIRIRWICTCGCQLYDDFTEGRPGAAKELEWALSSSSQQRPTTQPQPATGPYISSQLLGTGSSESPNSSLAQIANSYDPTSRTRYDPLVGIDRSTSTTIPCNPENEWLLVCARAALRPISLFHLDVGSTTSDQQLFTKLRQAYLQFKKASYQRLSFKTVRSIRFVQFELHPRDLVDVRKVPDMPPETKKDDYLYQTCDLLPPVGENLMTHLFHNPHEANEKIITYLRSPKKRKQKLAICQQRGTNIGWGIHLVEGWAVTKLWLSALAIVSCSFVFAVAWSVVKHDVQGAFGVAGWFVGLATLGLGSLQAVSQGE